MKGNKSRYLIDGLALTIKEVNLNECEGLILNIENGPILLVDKTTLVQARKLGDKASFNYLISASASISKDKYLHLSKAEETYMEIKIRERDKE